MTESAGIRTSLGQAAAWLGCACQAPQVEFAGVSSDSRRVQAGNLFVALRGPNHDGHDHVAAAAQAGAAAALVEQPVDVALPQLVVDSTRLGLGRLGAAWRAELGLPLVGITGSNGKTTAKEMTAAILAQRGTVFATRGNLNNEIGVPLSLLSLGRGHRLGVIEMGANHPGEIAYLTDLVRPQAALITNAGPAHLEGFGSVDGVAHAKAEIYRGLDASGTAIINADDAYAPLWRELTAGLHQVTFGIESPADFSADFQPEAGGSRMVLRTPAGQAEFFLPAAGRHNVLNALASCAAAAALGATPAEMAAGLSGLRPVAGRLHTRAALAGAQLIDDSYNANPASLAAGIEVLAARPGRRVLVLGDMAELGADAAEMHARAGQQARALGVDRLYAVGPLAGAAVAVFGPGGRHFDNQEALAAELAPELGPDVTVLVKGSRSARMERVVALLSPAGES